MITFLKQYDQPRFYDRETGEFTQEFDDYSAKVTEAGAANFDCEQIARAILDGLTPEEAAEQFNREHAEDRVPVDFEDLIGRDMSMNG